jgi:bacillithiol biosynthesis cysteine-adding enzyme BshC
MNIHIKHTGMFSRLITDYLDNRLPQDEYFSNGFTPVVSDQHFHQRNVFPMEKRVTLHRVFKEQYRFLNNDDPSYHLIHRQIDALLTPSTYTITTGQQIHIYIGPLYVPHKIMSLVLKARELQRQFADKQVVPVFWLASEDHDIHEINTVRVFGKTYHWNAPQGGMAGNLSTEGLSSIIQEIKSDFHIDQNGQEVLSVFEKVYNKGLTLSEAGRELIHHFYGQHGILVLDAAHPDLKKSFSPVVEKEIAEGFVYQQVRNQNEGFKKQAYDRQIIPKDTALFIIDEWGKRQRLDRTESGFICHPSGVQWTKDAVLSLLRQSPERLSPNVSLRPLYQEWILPNVAYIGGAGEVAYWLQLKRVFDDVNVTLPALILRKSRVYMGQKLLQKWVSEGLDMPLLLTPVPQYDQYIQTQFGGGKEVQHMREGLEKWEKEVADYLFSLDSASVKPFKNEVKQLRNYLNKQWDALSDKRETLVQKQIKGLAKIRDKMYPDGVFQERIIGFLEQRLLHPHTLEIPQNTTASDDHTIEVVEW